MECHSIQHSLETLDADFNLLMSGFSNIIINCSLGTIHYLLHGDGCIKNGNVLYLLIVVLLDAYLLVSPLVRDPDRV